MTDTTWGISPEDLIAMMGISPAEFNVLVEGLTSDNDYVPEPKLKLRRRVSNKAHSLVSTTVSSSKKVARTTYNGAAKTLDTVMIPVTWAEGKAINATKAMNAKIHEFLWNHPVLAEWIGIFLSTLGLTLMFSVIYVIAFVFIFALLMAFGLLIV